MSKKKRAQASGSGLADGIDVDSLRRAPLSAAIRKRANEIAARYTIYVAPNAYSSKPGSFLARVLELPYAFANGDTPEEALTKLERVMQTIIGAILERGDLPPEPGAANRTEQVNIRLTPGEKMRFERAAQNAGFRSISDYIRAAALRG